MHNITIAYMHAMTHGHTHAIKCKDRTHHRQAYTCAHPHRSCVHAHTLTSMRTYKHTCTHTKEGTQSHETATTHQADELHNFTHVLMQTYLWDHGIVCVHRASAYDKGPSMKLSCVIGVVFACSVSEGCAFTHYIVVCRWTTQSVRTRTGLSCCTSDG
jgi:hypothetical protein